jgi:hypothetical protein
VLYDSISYIAQEFGWYTSKCFDQYTPNFHVQTVHAGQMLRVLPSNTTLGHLKNEVIEQKHWKAKNMHTAQGVGRGGPSSLIRGAFFYISFKNTNINFLWYKMINVITMIKTYYDSNVLHIGEWDWMDLEKELLNQYVHVWYMII